jgi:pyruvate dehydrogenase E1 component alpha subunit
VCAHLTQRDYLTSTHRGHGHCIAKGVDTSGMMAEIYGKVSGSCRGKGGSMHITSPSNGFIGSMPIVGGTIPIALGAALTCRNQGSGNIAISYFGDGAVEEGVFHEALNLASIMSLPILFVCENNLFSSHLHISERQPSSNILRFAHANKIEGLTIDGNNIIEVSQQSSRLISEMRLTQQPRFIEALTYRFYGHVGHETDKNVGLNRKKDLKIWKQKDPVILLVNSLITNKEITENEVSKIERTVTDFVNKKWSEAEESAYPDQMQLLKNVYFEAI